VASRSAWVPHVIPTSHEARLIQPLRAQMLKTCFLTQLPKHDTLSKHQIHTDTYILRGRGLQHCRLREFRCVLSHGKAGLTA